MTCPRDEAIKIIADVIERECWADVDGEIMEIKQAVYFAINELESAGLKIVRNEVKR